MLYTDCNCVDNHAEEILKRCQMVQNITLYVVCLLPLEQMKSLYCIVFALV